MNDGIDGVKRILASKPLPAVALVMACLMSGVPPALAEEDGGFAIVEAQPSLRDGQLRLSLTLDFQFTDKVSEAVRNGIPVTLEVKVKVERPQQYWWPEEVAAMRQRYQLRYHALAQQYLVRNINSGAQSHFVDVHQALASIGQIRDLVLLKEADLADLDSYRLRIRSRLDIGALPVPLRLWAYLDPGWYLRSDWYEQSLTGLK